MIDNIKLLCPYVDTGGPENIHQLCMMLSYLKYDSSIVYFDQITNMHLPKFKIYNNKITSFNDINSKSLVIIPEYLPIQLHSKYENTAIFWLSVDNSFDVKKQNDIKRLSLDYNIKYHFTQSKYAYDFLSSLGIDNVFMISDYINEIYLKTPIIKNKKTQILYNPKKGIEFTKYILMSNSDIKFIPIQNMTQNQIIDLMDESMIYIDFGNHPGKDRLPREAAIRNCIIMTNNIGAAANNDDIPIPSKYKFSNSLGNLNQINQQLHFALLNYNSELLLFEKYREIIKNEKIIFKKQVEDCFSNIIKCS